MRKSLIAVILDLAFPPRCAGCGRWHEEIFCPPCRANLQPIGLPLCVCCGHPFDPLVCVLEDSVCADCRDNRYHHAPLIRARRAPFRYSGPLREAIHHFKYRGKTALSAPLAGLLDEYSRTPAARVIPFSELTLLVPVPLHPLRRWRRGYNQSALLAQDLSERWNVPTKEVLRRVRHTIPQVELDADERAQNVKNAFALDERAWQKYSRVGVRSALLIDDVATTTATLEECAHVLKRAGVEDIYALTLAR